ncbi:MAG: GIY-YIG nuclease superfamily protein [Candidatus Daviesbacteria bacterium GW2011_GWB1_36_5]|uniref:GIY-YIG nuclease superfamily protein n=3 Tax=Candidatus Daviesiibacteriota TaxID=1752718 RepID=A0A0G0EPV6_9BACT|nr:MAG: GIY-YIG nuclease superfamily protein [Candidatus Daviesbacteria bacterium GW2011_GWB1_36_5]
MAGQWQSTLMYYVYILKSQKDNNFYTGITNNIEIRLRQHNIGYSSTRSTKNRGPFILVFAQECSDRNEAHALEKYLKSGEGRELRDKLLK